MRLNFRKDQRGDTIVEVLIAVAIISLVVTTAYAISNKNTQAIQANSERVQAQHLVAAQIESLRAQNGITASGDCFNGSTETSTCTNFTQSGSGATYNVHITTGANNVYTITAKWTSLGGASANDGNVTMFYRLN